MNEEALKEEIVQNLLNPSKKALQINKNVRVITLDTYDFKEVKIQKNQQFFKQFKNLRGSIVEWLYIINVKLQDNPATFFHSVSLFDKLVSKTPSFLFPNNIDLYAGVCYFISKKINEIIIIDISFLKKIILKGKYDSQQIARAEIEICKQLNFNLLSSTIEDYTDFFITKIPSKLQSVFQSTNLFFNIFAQNFEQFIFNTFPLTVSIITLKVSLEILTQKEKLNKDEHDLITHLINSFVINHCQISKIAKINIKIKEYSVLLLNAFVNNQKFIQQKEYSKLYIQNFGIQ